MPGGGTPALEPIKSPALVCATAPGSNACAGDHDSAITPAAANRALPLNFICFPRVVSCEGDPHRMATVGSTQRRGMLLLAGHKDKPEMFLKIGNILMQAASSAFSLSGTAI